MNDDGGDQEESSGASCAQALSEMTLTDRNYDQSTDSGQLHEAFSTSVESGADCSSSGESTEQSLDNLNSYLQSHSVSQPLGSLVASGAVLEGLPGGPVQGITVTGTKTQICFDFTKGLCTRGDKCKYSHDLATIVHFNSKEKGICFDYLRNQCHRGLLCRFSHDLSNIAQQCRVPGQGPISPGATMNGRGNSSAICYDFVKGVCQRGGECRYSHDLSLIARTARGGVNSTRSGEVCYDYLRGRCNRGQSCKYAHNINFSTGMPGGQRGDAQTPSQSADNMSSPAAMLLATSSNDASMLSSLMAHQSMFGSMPSELGGRSLSGTDLVEGGMDNAPAWMWGSNSLPNHAAMQSAIAQQQQQRQRHIAAVAAAAGFSAFNGFNQHQMQQQSAAYSAAIATQLGRLRQSGGSSGPSPDQLAHSIAAAAMANTQKQQQQQQQAAAMVALMQHQAQNNMAGQQGRMQTQTSSAAAAAAHLMRANSAPANMPFLNVGGMSGDHIQAILSQLPTDNPALLAETLNGLATAAAQAQAHGYAHAQAQQMAARMMQQQQHAPGGQGKRTPSPFLGSNNYGGPPPGAPHLQPKGQASQPQPIPGRHDSSSPQSSYGRGVQGSFSGPGASVTSSHGDGKVLMSAHTAPATNDPLGSASLSADLMPLLKEIWNKAG